MNDPIVDEVRRWRMEHTRQFGGDLDRICKELQRLQQEAGGNVIRRPAKYLNRSSTSGKQSAGNV